MAPESIIDRKYSSASDVWSFGVLAWETFSFGERPYKKMKADEVMLAIVQQGYRMPQPDKCPSDV